MYLMVIQMEAVMSRSQCLNHSTQVVSDFTQSPTKTESNFHSVYTVMRKVNLVFLIFNLEFFYSFITAHKEIR
jgi:hypothetical protein